ncbi:hypothetical protein L2E82_50697 [Cichorium intybus]|nr:hypothetical protein L2E82_50697 [Cichorium intybus]
MDQRNKTVGNLVILTITCQWIQQTINVKVDEPLYVVRVVDKVVDSAYWASNFKRAISQDNDESEEEWEGDDFLVSSLTTFSVTSNKVNRDGDKAMGNKLHYSKFDHDGDRSNDKRVLKHTTSIKMNVNNFELFRMDPLSPVLPI